MEDIRGEESRHMMLVTRVSVGCRKTSRRVYTRWNYTGYEIRFGI